MIHSSLKQIFRENIHREQHISPGEELHYP